MVAVRTRQFTATGLPGVPLVRPGEDLVEVVCVGLAAAGLELDDGDVVVVAQKIVSKAEGRIVRLRQVTPSTEARRLAAETGKDARLVEVILGESSQVLRTRADLIIVEHRLGFVCANAGVDRSNVEQDATDDESVTLLPADPDRSARQLAEGLRARTNRRVAVVISDSHGRAFRVGAIGVAIGVAGLVPVEDRRGEPDLFGYRLRVTDVGRGDEIASAASLLMGQTAEATPIVLLRGVPFTSGEGGVAALVRPRDLDLFR